MTDPHQKAEQLVTLADVHEQGRSGEGCAVTYEATDDDPIILEKKLGLGGDRPLARTREALEVLRKKVEVENQAIRLEVFKYDSVVHDRRERIWGWRRSLLSTQAREAWLESVRDLIDDLLGRLDLLHPVLRDFLGVRLYQCDFKLWRIIIGSLFRQCES